MTTNNTVVFYNVATTPQWGEPEPASGPLGAYGIYVSWPYSADVKTAPGYTLYNVVLDDTNAAAENVLIVPTSVTTYLLPNTPPAAGTVPLTDPIAGIPNYLFGYNISDFPASAKIGAASISSTNAATASAQALVALEQSYSTAITTNNPNRVVLDISGHGNEQSFLQGALNTADSIKLVNYLREISGSAQIILDTSACNQGSYSFIREYANGATYMIASEQEVGTGGPAPTLTAQYINFFRDGTLAQAWATGNSTTQAFQTILSNITQWWNLFNYSTLPATTAEQSLSIYQMSSYQNLIDALGTLPQSAYSSFSKGSDISAYIMSSGNQALINAFNSFEIGYASNSPEVNWTDSSHGLGLIQSAVSDLQRRATIADGATSSGVTVTAELSSFQSSAFYNNTLIVDTAANVQANLDKIETMMEGGTGQLGNPVYAPENGIELTNSGTPTLTLTAAQLVNDGLALNQIYSNFNIAATNVSVADALGTSLFGHVISVAVTDTAANVIASLDTLQSLAASGMLASIALTDGGIPALSLTAAQLANDAKALADISGYYVLDVTASTSTSQSITGSPQGSTIIFSGTASSYTITSAGDGTSFTITNGTVTDHLTGVTALQFGDHTDFVASQTPTVTGSVSSAQMANLYAAVFGREPDVAGLAYYENIAATQPGTQITSYAKSFLQSPEYTGSLAHNYAQSAAGDASFVTDTYANLLHRTPEAGAVDWYQANVFTPTLVGLTPGTAAYTAAELTAHAAVLADFSQSVEFVGNVQVTAATPSSSSHWLILI